MAHYGWTWQYLLWGVRWPILQKMLIDAPWYDYEKKKDVKEVALTDDNAEEIMQMINRSQGR